MTFCHISSANYVLIYIYKYSKSVNINLNGKAYIVINVGNSQKLINSPKYKWKQHSKILIHKQIYSHLNIMKSKFRITKLIYPKQANKRHWCCLNSKNSSMHLSPKSRHKSSGAITFSIGM